MDIPDQERQTWLCNSLQVPNAAPAKSVIKSKLLTVVTYDVFLKISNYLVILLRLTRVIRFTANKLDQMWSAVNSSTYIQTYAD